MKNRNYDELDKLICASMEITDTASTELNNCLKATLYEKQALMKQKTNTRAFSLWYVPMVFNFIVFSLFAVCCLIAIENSYIAKFAACLCVYAAIAGIAITVVAVTRTRIKENLVINIKKRGATV